MTGAVGRTVIGAVSGDGRGHGLSLKGGHIAFGTRPGLHDISLHVPRGRRLALLGPSGSGKTSLLRALAGLGGLTAGRLLVDGRDVAADPPERRSIVYMHQTPGLFPHLTVRANVAFPLEVRGVSATDAARRADALLDRVQLSPVAHRRPATLSGGQRHRVALARALAADPAVLLLDEPFAALDPELRDDVRVAVLELLAESNGPAVVLVTHDVDEAASLADEMLVLLHGTIAQAGAPAVLLARPASVAVARFLGLANVVRGERHADGRVTSAFGIHTQPGRPGPVALTARPGDVRITTARAPAPATVLAVSERVAGLFVRVRVGSEELLGVADRDTAPAVGAPASVTVAAAAVHVIDERLPEG